jgi:adhesin/invasin
LPTSAIIAFVGWIVDAGNHALRWIDPLGTEVITVAGTGEAGFNGDGRPPRETQLNNPSAVVVTTHGQVFIADAGNHRVRLFRFQTSS